MALFMRRMHWRRLFIIGIVLTLFVVFMTLVQFSQIETTQINKHINRHHYRDQQPNHEHNEDDNEQRDKLNDLKARAEVSRLNKWQRQFKRPDESEADMTSFHYNNDKTMSRTISAMEKMVHIDLKGSPLKLAYYKELLPYIKKLGATGVLIEYEDYFPYVNDLDGIANQNHYTSSELTALFKLVADNGLRLIPLIQTYGHLEFVLKLKHFAKYREAPQHFQVITPCLNETYEQVLFKMLGQVLDAHPEDLEYIHIGCDEVYHYGVNEACAKMTPPLRTIQDYFIYHITKLLDFIKSKRPHLKVLIWDDMIRYNMLKEDTPSKDLMHFAKRVVPMVWDYNTEMKVSRQTWQKYDKLFDEVWMASAFKGATSILELIPNASKHYKNHLSWLNTLRTFNNPHKFKGIALTGWSRYDHMQAVCEIMPGAIPSLSLSLRAFINFNTDESELFASMLDLTGCNFNRSATGFLLDPAWLVEQPDFQKLTSLKDLYTCSFPGAKIYTWLLNLKLLLQYFEREHMVNLQTLNSYSLKNRFFNTMIYEQGALKFYPQVRAELKRFMESGDQLFDKYFYADLHDELKAVYVQRYIDIIDQRLGELNKTALPESAPIRPFDKISPSLL